MKNMIMNFLRRFFFPAAKEDLEPLATRKDQKILDHERQIVRLEERVGV